MPKDLHLQRLQAARLNSTTESAAEQHAGEVAVVASSSGSI